MPDTRSQKPWEKIKDMSILLDFIDVLLILLTWAIIIRVVLSWSWFNLRPDNPLMTVLYRITEPILAPLRQIVPSVGTIDITPMVAIILLWLIRILVYSFS